MDELQPVDFDMDWLARAFPALCKPRREGLGQSLRLYVKACLESPFTDGKRVIKFRQVREIPHAEVVEPLERTRPPLPGDHHVHVKFLRVHAESISEEATVA